MGLGSSFLTKTFSYMGFWNSVSQIFDRERRYFLTPRKEGFRLFRNSSLSFWVRTFKLSECVPWTMAKILWEAELWFRAPKFFIKFSKMAKILNFFIFWARTFKLSGYIDFGTLISYMLKFFQSDEKWIYENFFKNTFLFTYITLCKFSVC